MKNIVLVFIIVLGSSFSLSAQDSFNTSLAGRWGLNNCHSMAVIGNYAYTNSGRRFMIMDVSVPSSPVVKGEITLNYHIVKIVVQGNFAYAIAQPAGFYIIDISDPSNPHQVSYTHEGYVLGLDVSGNYAYITNESFGLLIFDISNAYNPLAKGSCSIEGYGYDIDVQGNFAYIASHFGGLRIIDISNASAPFESGFYYTDEYMYSDGIAVRGNYAYVAFDNGMYIIDVSDSASPTETGVYNNQDGNYMDVELHGDYAFLSSNTDTSRIIFTGNPESPQFVSSLSHSNAIAVYGDYAFLASTQTMGIIDISNPTNTFPLCNYQMYGDVRGIALKDSLAYIADYSGRLRILNISNLDHIVESGNCSIQGNVNNVFINGNLAYVAAMTAGLHIIDISNPVNPIELGYCDTPGKAYKVTVNGNYAYVSDNTEGMRIIDISNPASPYEVGFFDKSSETRDVSIKGSLAYVAHGWDGIKIVNIANPSWPIEVGDFDTPGWPRGIDIKDNLLFVADQNGIIILDITVPEIPVEVWYLSNEFCIDVVVENNYAYFIGDGIKIFDISNPSDPKEIAYYDSGGDKAVAVSGINIYVDEQGISILNMVQPTAIKYENLQPKSVDISFDNKHFIFTLEAKSFVSLTLFDCLGKQVANLVSREFPVGRHQVSFDDNQLKNGVYLYSFNSGNRTMTGKLIKFNN